MWVPFLLLLKVLQVSCSSVIWGVLERLLGERQEKERSSFKSGYLAFKQHLSLFNCRRSEGLSGRVLRKLPFLAHALYIQVSLFYLLWFCLVLKRVGRHLDTARSKRSGLNTSFNLNGTVSAALETETILCCP